MDGELEQVTRCPGCEAQEKMFLFQGRDDRYGYPASFPVVQCRRCGLVYLAARIREARLANLYEQYYSLLKPQDNPKPSLGSRLPLSKSFLLKVYRWFRIKPEDLYQDIPRHPGTRILDIGSGTVMENARAIVDQGGDWLAVEVDARKCQLLEKAGFKTYCGALEAFQHTHPAPFDYIVLSHVFEHVYHPRRFLAACRSLLRPGGRIILSCPNYDSFLRAQHGQRWLHWHIPYHVAHYSQASLRFLTRSVGLQMASFFTHTSVTWFYAQNRLARGVPYNDDLLVKPGLRWGQRLLDLYLHPFNRSHRGDVLFAELELAA